MLPETTSLGLRLVVDGNLPRQQSVSADTRQRKGWLLLVPGPQVASEDLPKAHDHYYHSSRYDVESMLIESMWVASGAQEGDDARWNCCGAVLIDLDVTALLPAGFGMWVASGDGLKPVTSWPVPTASDKGGSTLRRSHHRMRPGETLVLGSTDLEAIWQSRRIARAACRCPARFHQLVRRIAARRGLGSQPSIALVSYPTGTPVALEQPWSGSAVLLPPREAPAKAHRLSPIWIAVAITLLSTVGVYAAKRPTLLEANWSETITFLLTMDRWEQPNQGESGSPSVSPGD